MVKIKGLIFINLLILLAFESYAQSDINRYAIFFKDKSNSSFSTDRPEEFLSPRSIERKKKQNIPITVEDLPVNKHYLDSLTRLGFYVFYQSRWTNSVLVQDSKLKVDQLVNKSFIDSVVLLAPRTKLTSTLSQPSYPSDVIRLNTTSLSSNNQNAMIGVDKMHSAGFLGEDKLIVVLDGGFTGVNRSEVFRHILDQNRLVDVFDFVSFGRDVFRYDDHGTSVLSTIAANSSNYVGTAPNSKFALFVTEESGSEYIIEEYNLLLGVERADSIGADIINSSVGYNTFDDKTMDYTYSDMDGTKAIATLAADKAVAKGMVYVSSAGNEGNKSWKYVTVPADGVNVLAIGATSPNGNLAGFSSLGPTSDGRLKPDLIAMGSPCVVLNGNGQFENGFGTSYSAPQVAGLAAGVWQARPDWNSNQVVAALRGSGDLSGTPNNNRGFGIPNFERAINGTVLSAKDILENKISVYPNPFIGNELYIQIDKTLLNQNLSVVLYNILGVEIQKWEFKKLDAEKIELRTVDLPSGNYYMSLVHENNWKTVKLIKY